MCNLRLGNAQKANRHQICFVQNLVGVRLLSGLNHANVKRDLETIPDCTKDGGQVVHAGVPFWGQHAVEALAGFVSQFSQALESDCGVHEVTENEASRIRFAAEKERGRFIEKGFGKGRVALNALDNGLLKITGQRHAFFPFLAIARAFFLALYSSYKATA